MSLSATMWAWEQRQVRGSTKLVLLCFAEHYNDEREATWPSSPAVSEATGLDRKTIVSCLSELREKGLIEDSGERVGKTKQVVVYRLPGVPEFRNSVREAANKQARYWGSYDQGEQAQKRNSTENGTVPVFPSNRPVFPAKQAQKRATEPLKEPLREPVTCEHAENGGSSAPHSVENRTPADPDQVSPRPKTPDCPHQAIVDLYHETLPTLTRHVVWNESRRKNLQARWRESAKRQTLDWWKTFFAHVAASDFLMGRTQARDGRPPFQADLEWLTKPGNFAKVVEGKYHA